MRHPEPGEEGPSGRPSPSSARRSLGEELRVLRESAGLTLYEAAARIQRSAPTLSRLENSKSSPRLVDVKGLLDFYAERSPSAVTAEVRDRTVQLAEAAREEPWFSSFRDVISGDMTASDIQRYVEFESDATKIRSYQPELIPGLLQTRGYAEAVTELLFPDRSVKDRARFVEFRLARQDALKRREAPLDIDVVIGEAALRQVIGPADVMTEQVQAVLDDLSGGRSNVRIRVAPIARSVPAMWGGPFVVMNLPGDDATGLVYLEGRAGATYLQSASELTRYRGLFEDLDGAVLDRVDSTALLEGVLGDLARRD